MRAGEITIDGAGFTYGAQSALAQLAVTESTTKAADISDIDLDIAPGSAVVLCGPSGSGKTTLLRLLGGLAPQLHAGTTSGTVTVSGQEMTTLDVHRVVEVAATVFQNPRTQFFTTEVAGELAFGLENQALARDEILDRIRSAVAVTGIGGLLNRRLDSLSGGQLQLVACTAALAQRPGVILFDEPSANLSPASVDILVAVMHGLKQAGHTLVIAEHRLAYLDGVIDRAVLLADGRVAEDMSAEDFFAQTDQQRRERGLRRLQSAHVPQSQPMVDTTSNSGLAIEDLRFSYGSTPVTDIPHMVFPRGRITALTGPNGAGKTTLARLICGLAKQDSGTIRLGGKTLGPRARNRAASMVMQDVGRQLFGETVRADVTMGLTVAEREALDLPTLLDATGLTGLEDRHPQSLSGGQRQRVAIAATAATHSPIFVFDEPTSGLGFSHLIGIAAQMRALADQGAVVIVITHDDELIAEAADSVFSLTPLQEG
ncbi:ABC transporter ATP-binding protein [Brevibacterium sediminis]|uniref:ABC transporter ATP-binding protein n=1 Tax=Brevibacterium sediminis TaxID=1857024 RepID=UPI00217535A5|nr:ABC transporter ATP-binding protein [Brevibacterium sediminis]MCS4592284.1 ABC transporter ATP-binding protein [Brevibacterium sediminis]